MPRLGNYRRYRGRVPHPAPTPPPVEYSDPAQVPAPLQVPVSIRAVHNRGSMGISRGRGRDRTIPERLDYKEELSFLGSQMIEELESEPITKRSVKNFFISFVDKALNDSSMFSSLSYENKAEISYMLIELPKEEVIEMCNDFSGKFTSKVLELAEKFI